MSKGSTQRPQSVDEQTFAANWDRIFNGKQQQEQKEQAKPEKAA